MIHWADGGPTDLGNLVSLCGFHHRFVHAHGWDIEVRPDGRHRYTPPDATGPQPRTGALPGACAEAVTAAAPASASAEALRPPTHTGARCDLDTAVATLQHAWHRAHPDLALAS